jgi:hypothetical protein
MNDAPSGARRRRYGAPKNWRDIFIARLGETSSIVDAADAAEISISWVYKMRRADPDFARRWFEALCEGYDNLEMELLRHLRSGDADDAGAAPKRKFDAATALRSLAAHRENVAREKGRRTLAQEAATIEAINAKIDALRAQARAGDAAVRKTRAAAKPARAKKLTKAKSKPKGPGSHGPH